MVETGGLENRFTLTGNGGSNPSPSAIPTLQFLQYEKHKGASSEILAPFNPSYFG